MQPGFTWVSTSPALGGKGNVSSRASLQFVTNVGGVAHYFSLYPGVSRARFAVDPVHGRHCFRLREIDQRLLMPEYQIAVEDVVHSYGHFRYFLIEEHDFTPTVDVAAVLPALDNLRNFSAASLMLPTTTTNPATAALADNIDEYLTKAEQAEIERQASEKAQREYEGELLRQREKVIEAFRQKAEMEAKQALRDSLSKPDRESNETN